MHFLVLSQWNDTQFSYGVREKKTNALFTRANLILQCDKYCFELCTYGALLFAVLPSFSGNVPAVFSKLFPSANITQLGDW
jgi:hypothetical protein